MLRFKIRCPIYLALGFACSAFPDAAKQPKPDAPPKKTDPWEQFVPPPDKKFDWIQLDSGEWFKGEFKMMYNRVLEFNSEEMDFQKFDFDDVVRLRTRTAQSVLTEPTRGDKDSEGTVMRGLLEIIGDKVFLRNGDEVTELNRNQLVSIATGNKNRLKWWSGKISIGMNKRGGNTETTDSTIKVNLKRSTALTRLVADYTANYSSADGKKTTDNQRLKSYFDRFISPRTYWEIGYLEYYRDTFANIDAQYSVATGLGYDIIRSSKTDWSVKAGIGYQEQKYVTVEEGEKDRSSSPFFLAGLNFDRDLTTRIEYLLDYEMRFLNDDNGRYTHHLVSTVSVDLVKDFDIDLSVVWDRTEKPQQGSDGELPQQDDYQFIVSITYEF